MLTIFKVFIEFVAYCFCFMFCSFGHETCGLLAPQPGIRPVPAALEGKVQSSGLPGKSLKEIYKLRSEIWERRWKQTRSEQRE